MAKKSQNPNQNSALRTKAAIQAEMNQALFEHGNICANIHLLHKQKGTNLLKIERLSKEQPAPSDVAKSPDVKDEV